MTLLPGHTRASGRASKLSRRESLREYAGGWAHAGVAPGIPTHLRRASLNPTESNVVLDTSPAARTDRCPSASPSLRQHRSRSLGNGSGWRVRTQAALSARRPHCSLLTHPANFLASSLLPPLP